MKTSEPVKIGVKKMSIVNGAQTCSAIFDCMKDQYPDFGRFEKLSVLFRLFKTDDPQTISQIAISTNSQNRIQPRDLCANDTFQLDLEVKLAQKGVKYLRKRGSFEEFSEDENKLDALKAGQLILSHAHLKPAQAKKESDRIFSDRYNEIFAKVDISRLLRAYQLYGKIEELQKFIADEIRIRGVSRTENTFITYGGFHVLAICSKLEEIYPKKTDDELINNALDIIAQTLLKVGQPAYYNFFRDSAFADKMIDMCAQPDLFDQVKKAGT